MKKIVFTILTLIIIMVGMTNSLASGDITPFAVRDPNDVKPLPYEGSGKTSGTMSPALRAPSDGKITIYFKDCAFVGKSSGNTHPTKSPSKVTVWVERHKSGTTWVSEKAKTTVTLSGGEGEIDFTVTANAIISVHFTAPDIPNGYTFKYTRGVKEQ